MARKLQLVPPLAFELLGMLKSWQGHICPQWDPSWSCERGPGTSRAWCHRSWMWPNLQLDGDRGLSSYEGGTLSGSGSLNTCNYV